MSAIRPDLPQTLPAAPAIPSAQARAAQAAFFRAALSDVQAAPARPAAGQPLAQASDTEAPRLPRLGQLLDIRV